jgi:hypothetical protein
MRSQGTQICEKWIGFLSRSSFDKELPRDANSTENHRAPEGGMA